MHGPIVTDAEASSVTDAEASSVTDAEASSDEQCACLIHLRSMGLPSMLLNDVVDLRYSEL